MKNSIQTLFLVLSLALLLVCCFGCRQKKPDGMPTLYPCTLVILQDGKPLVDGFVSANPIDGKWGANGRTNEKGRVILYTWGLYKGAAEGSYKITVRKEEVIPAAPPTRPNEIVYDDVFRLVDKQYGKKTSTPLTIAVTKGYAGETFDVGKPIHEKLPQLR